MKDGRSFFLRIHVIRAEETKNGDEFSKELASLCDVFVNDAFGTAHRAHCSQRWCYQICRYGSCWISDAKEIDFLGNAVKNPKDHL